MNEENIHNEQQQIPLDQALKECRLAANLSVDELAQRLNLKASVILNLENNLDKVVSDGIYPLIYLRGYLINYSKELKFPDVESYPEFQQLSHPSESVTSLQNTYIFTDKQKLSKKILLLTLVIVTMGVMTFVYFSNSSTAVSGETEEEQSVEPSKVENATLELPSVPEKEEKVVKEAEAPEILENEEYVAIPDVQEAIIPDAVEDTATPLTTSPEVVEEEVVEISKAEPAVSTSVTQLAVEETQLAVEEPQVQLDVEGNTLKLLFEERSWAVVTDAKDQRLAFGIYESGKELDLVGTAPFSLKIGNPTSVVFYYEDQLVENNFVRGRMATFSLPE